VRRGGPLRQGRIPYRDFVERIVKEIMPLIRKDEDFALIEDKKRRRFTIEPTRDLCLLLTHYFKLSTDAGIESVVENEREVIYTVKAVVWDREGNKSSGLGLASTKESWTPGRERHDAITKAETRATKRAIEAQSGYPIINKLILHLYGGFILDQAMRPVGGVQVENGNIPAAELSAAPPARPQMPAPVARPAALPDASLIAISDSLAKMGWLEANMRSQHMRQATIYANRKDLRSLQGLQQSLNKQIHLHEGKGKA
jgi:hypothetical protein